MLLYIQCLRMSRDVSRDDEDTSGGESPQLRVSAREIDIHGSPATPETSHSPELPDLPGGGNTSVSPEQPQPSTSQVRTIPLIL